LLSPDTVPRDATLAAVGPNAPRSTPDTRLYTPPDTPPKVYASGFGPKAAQPIGRIGD
jgi:hypothetical protein